MNTLSLLNFIAFIVNLFMIIFILARKKRITLHYVCSLLIGCFALWSFVHIFKMSALSREKAIIWDNIATIGWIGFASIALWFSLLLTKKEKILKQPFFYIFIFLIPIILTYKQLKDSSLMIYSYERVPCGWIELWTNSIWMYIFDIYYMSFLIIVLYLTYDFSKKSKRFYEKRQSRVIFFSTLIGLITSTITDVVLPQLGYKIPSVTNLIATFIWNLGIVYAITRYRLMNISLSIAANKVISTIPDMVIVISTDMEIIEVNEATKELTKYEFKEIIGRPINVIFEQDNDILVKWDRLLRGETIKNCDTHFITKEGKKIPVNCSYSSVKDKFGEVIGVVCIAKDMTEIIKLQQKEKELTKIAYEAEQEKLRILEEYSKNLEKKVEERTKELKKSEERFKQVIENAQEWVWEVDKDGLYTYTSPIIEKILGYKPEEVIGKKHFYDFFLPEEREQLKKSAFEVFSKKLSFKEFINRNLHKNGKIVYLSTSGIPIFDEKGNLLGYRGVDADITERKQMEEEKEKLYKKIIESEKLSAVGQLAAGVAHEMNNPMGVILGFAQLVLKDIKKDDPLYMPLKSIEKEAIRCKKLVGDLLTFSRVGRIDKDLSDINELIEKTLTLVKAQARVRGVEIIKENGNDLPQIMVNKNQIQQVIASLCNNAIDAMPEGGKITIKTALKIPDVDVAAERSSANNGTDKPESQKFIEITVSDTGTGMPEEVKKRIFEPFFTTKEVGKGTGLGLSLVYEIIQKHKGTIEVESEFGKGTTFKIELPVSYE